MQKRVLYKDCKIDKLHLFIQLPDPRNANFWLISSTIKTDLQGSKLITYTTKRSNLVSGTYLSDFLEIGLQNKIISSHTDCLKGRHLITFNGAKMSQLSDETFWFVM